MWDEYIIWMVTPTFAGAFSSSESLESSLLLDAALVAAAGFAGTTLADKNITGEI